MKTSSDRLRKLIQIGRGSRLTPAVVCTTCFTLVLVAVMVRVGKAASPTENRELRLSRLHKRNRFFNPKAAAAAAPTAAATAAAATTAVAAPAVPFPTVDQVLSLKEVPVADPMAIVWDPVAQGPIPGPDTPLNFQPLSAEIVKDQAALIRLGKALFWDMQVGSDGVLSCATCHFSAGADIRTTNQISPNLSDANFKANAAGVAGGSALGGDALFGNSTVPFTANDPNFGILIEPPDPNFNVPGHPSFGPNYQMIADDFPLNDWFRPTELTPRITLSAPNVTLFDEMANVSRDTNDIVASQGVRFTTFSGVNPGSAVDSGTPKADIFNTVTPGKLNLNGRVRRAMPRNSPTMINAVFNFDNLWEGRASFVFNGVNAAGFRDLTSKVQKNVSGTLTPVFLRITNSSLASVAVGPPTSNIAMSFAGRTMPDVGKKMVSLRPLGKQFVHPHDSVLGSLSRASLSSSGALRGSRGLNVPTYCEMIQAAFQDQWWNHPDALTPVVAPKAAQQVSTTSAQPSSEIEMDDDSHASTQSLPEVTVSKAIPMKAKHHGEDDDEGAGGTGGSGGTGGGSGGGRRACLGGAALATGYTQMQMNFSLFFGLAVQAYEATLISDDTPFDRFQGAQNPVRQADGSPCPATGCPAILGDPTALTTQQSVGLSVFLDDNANLGTHCADCHILPITTGHTILDYQPDSQGVPSLAQGEAIEFMIMGDNLEEANYDHGMYNIGVRRSGCGPDPTITCGAEDKGRAATSGSVNPLTNKPFPDSLVELTALRGSTSCDTASISHVGCLPPDVARFIPDVPILPRRVTNGAFKASNLRNIKYSGPYFHIGDSSTLRQVVEFYTRGGNFPNTNLHDKTVDVDGIPPLMFPEFDPTSRALMEALVEFLANGLTDNRVAFEQGPFDHPQLFVPNGSPKNHPDQDVMIEVPAVGKEGRATELPTFLNLDPQTP
jgi:cytochrome c peroxidase